MVNEFWHKHQMVIVFTVSCFLMGAAWLLTTAIHSDNHYQAVQIKKGDSVWKLAENYAAKTNMDKFAFVKWVEEENHLVEGELRAGDSIIIPVKKDAFNPEQPVQLAK